MNWIDRIVLAFASTAIALLILVALSAAAFSLRQLFEACQ